MKLGTMKAQLPWALEEADLSFSLQGDYGWSVREALAPLGSTAMVADSVDALVAAIVRAVQPGDHVLCMSNGGFGGIHGKLLDALKAKAPDRRTDRRAWRRQCAYPPSLPARIPLIAALVQARACKPGWPSTGPGALVVPAAAAVTARGDGARAAGHRRLPLDASAVLGSSLGGFYAPGWPRPPLAGRAAEPGRDPARDLAPYVGELTPSTHRRNGSLSAPSMSANCARWRCRDHAARALLRRHRQGRRGARLARDERALSRRADPPARGRRHALSDFDDHLPTS